MNVADFDYELPEELIAQKPCDRRDGSRLLVVDRKTGIIKHEHFYDIEKYLRPDDCLVLNDSKVIPERLFGTKDITGAKIEFLLTKRIDGDIWETMVRPGKRLKPGDKVIFEDDFTAEILENGEDKIVGIDVALAHQIADDMGKDLDIADMNFDNLLTLMAQGNCDFVIAAMEESPDRLENASCSDP